MFRSSVTRLCPIWAALVFLLCGTARSQSSMVTLPDGTVIAGPWKLEGDIYFPDRPPIAAVNVDCPSDVAVITESTSSSTEWVTTSEVTVTGGWGPISGALSASFGFTVGQSHTIEISLTVSADPYKSKVVKIYTRYERYQFLVWPPELDRGYTVVVVHVPVGWQKVFW